MPDTVNIHYVDCTHIRLSCTNQGIISEISDSFSFEAEGAKFHPLVKNHLWDGLIRLFNRRNNTIYYGLLPHIIKFCEDRKYDFTIDPILFKLLEKNHDFNVEEYVKTLGLKVNPQEHQLKAIEKIIKDKRCLIISPTSSGKSLIIYCVLRWMIDNLNGKILTIVPIIDLTHQLLKEFKEYSDFPIEDYVHLIYGGKPKITDKKIIISTWQSIYEMPKKYFQQFGAILGDEAHETVTAESSKGIFDKSTLAQYRVGLTGTIKETKVHKLVLEGVTGEIYKVISTKELMDSGKVSQLLIKCVILKYSEELRKQNRNLNYNDEKQFISNFEKRNKILAGLAGGIKGENVLILVKYLEHVAALKKELEKYGKTIFVITGSTDTDERIKNKIATEVLNDVVIIATERVFSTGISIKNLQNLIIAIGGKSSIRLLQSIGRILRLDGKLNRCVLYDFVDDFSYQGRKNYLLKHFFERVKIYNSEKFTFELTNMRI